MPFPQGLAGRQVGPAKRVADDGRLQCDFCHRSYNPFFEATNLGTREGGDRLNYWDETNASATPSQTAAATTYQEDTVQAQAAKLFNGGSFFVDNQPLSASYLENGAGQYFVSGGSQKRASFADANAKHQFLYSRYHKSKYFCSTCHDVSNPALANLSFDGTPPGDGATILPTEQDSAYSYFHVERTFSEFMLSAYGQQGGAPGMGPFAPGLFETSLANNNVARCQDCHMRDVQGVGCNKAGSPNRPTDSIEHPNSGQPLHDMTGGNIFVSYVLASAVAGSPNYDATNSQLLNQGPGVLTLDLTQGLGINPQALLAGVDRAKQQLLLAASVDNISFDPPTGTLTFRVQNQTGHKLISGFPEGRRMFVNVRAYLGGSLVYEMNPYDPAVGTLKGLDPSYSQSSPPLGPGEQHLDELVYEMHPTSTLTGEDETFHFALATGRYKDNRIPPKGFRISDAASRLSEPVWHGASDPNYFTSAEYAGGYDDVSLNIPVSADAVEVSLYYQSTSREYMEFLRDEINGTRQTLPPDAYIIQTDPFFSKLKAWGDTIWQLWDHNKNLPGAAPFLMAQSSVNVENPCTPPIPTLLYAEPGDGTVTLTWGDEHSADPDVIGYSIYYDQAGKAQLVDSVGLTTTYTDTGLVVGQQHCYKVTSVYSACESGYSNVLCVTPAPLFSIGGARGLADGSWVYIQDAVVTAGSAVGWGCSFVESLSRASGIKLDTNEALSIGDKLGFTGMISRPDGEWQIGSVSLVSVMNSDPLAPMGLNSKAICTDPTESLSYLGINSSGLLVRIWGTVTSVNAAGSVAYVDDGGGCHDGLSSAAGIRVQFPSGIGLPAEGSFVGVTGISRVEMRTLADWSYVNGQSYPPGTVVYVPSIWVRESGDVTSAP